MRKSILTIYFDQDEDKPMALVDAEGMKSEYPTMEVKVQKVVSIGDTDHHNRIFTFEINRSCLWKITERCNFATPALINRLAEYGINSIDQLKTVTKADLLAMPNLGKKGLEDARQLFEELGIPLQEHRTF